MQKYGDPENLYCQTFKRSAPSIWGFSKKLGILAGIDENSASSCMNQYEMGKHITNFIMLKRIGKILGYPMEFFYSDNDVTVKIICLIERLSDEDKIPVLNSLKNLVLKYEKDLFLVE